MTRRGIVLLLALLALLAAGLALARVGRDAPPAATSASRADATLELVTPAGTRRFTLAELKAAIPVESAAVSRDPSYQGRPKRYAGFPLARVLALAGLRPTGAEVLYFQAADGYRATLAAPADAGGTRGLVAFADLDAPGGWEPVGTGAARKTPAPFYLVWTDSAAADSSALRRPWPYQLVRIEVVDPRARYDRIYPEGVAADDPVYRGYQAFVIESHGGDQCIACHSLNLQGGTVGPELNVPRNITEYRDEATLVAFIRDARRFRARSAMPPFEGVLSDAQIADILAYLRWLRGHQVGVPAAAE